MALEEKIIHKALLEGTNILDEEIARNYHCEINPVSTMFGESERLEALHERGNFCLSFKFWKNGGNKDMNPQKCVRVWHTNTIVDKERFHLISEKLTSLNLPYFTKFIYKEEGLNVNGNKVPVIFMDWIDGMTMSKWIPANKKTPHNIGLLADEFLKMSCKLNELGIAHGDLCNENILITQSLKIKLVDYDSVYVPAMGERFPAVTGGWPDFQHPKRKSNLKATAYDDYFSQHVIYFSLLAYSRFPELIPDNAEKSLLFHSIDYQSKTSFTNANIYKFITQNCKHDNETDKILLKELGILAQAVTGDINSIPPLKNYSIDKFNGEENNNQQTNLNPTSPIGGINNWTITPPRPIAPKTISIPWYKKWRVWIYALVVAIGIGYFVINAITTEKTSLEKTVLNENIIKAIYNLEGNYTFREKNGSIPVNGIRTAAIKKISDSRARILVTSEYGPEFYDFTFASEGNVQSETLGAGEISYNERLDKITIIFKKGDKICEFTK